ncbi:hypothetical protein CL684_00220 [Candidatus Campbellbacteria bacterium]|nr:hypothetical protein [Candidatus Campbellbacteria bacterium]|tara:strand:+ start:678 stop:2420 length:1743 start_codon:yes stop_codon:yes gene_type:complete
MRKISFFTFALFFASLFFTSCEKEDDDVITEPEPEIPTNVGDILLEGNVDGNEWVLVAETSISGNPTNIQAYIENTVPTTPTMEVQDSLYTFTFRRPIESVIPGDTFTVKVSVDRPDGSQSVNTSNTVSYDPSADPKYIRFYNVRQGEIANGMVQVLMDYGENDVLDGQSEYRLFLNSNPVGDTGILTMPFDEGTVDFLVPIDEISFEAEHQLRLRNVPGNDTYDFLINAQGDTAEQVVFDITFEVMNSATVNSFHVEPANTSATASGNITLDCTQSCDIFLKAFHNGTELDSQTVSLDANGDFITDVDGLSAGTTYDFKLFLNEMEIASETETTLDDNIVEWNFVGEQEVTNVGAKILYSFVNTRNSEVTMELSFTGNGQTQTTFFDLPPNSGLTSGFVQSPEFMQLTQIDVSAMAGGQSYGNYSFTTIANEYTNHYNILPNGMIADPGQVVNVMPGQTLSGGVRCTSNGPAETQRFVYHVVMPAGEHPADYISAIGISPSENVITSNPGDWDMVATDTYEIPLITPKPIATGVNNFAVNIYLANYSPPLLSPFTLTTYVVDNESAEISGGYPMVIQTQ